MIRSREGCFLLHGFFVIDTILDVGFLAYDIYRLVYDNILHDCDNLNENLFSLLLDVGGLLLPGLTGLGHADEAYDLWRYADELPEASRFADDAVRRVDDLADSRRYGDDVAKNLDCLVNSFSADTPVMTAEGEVAISEIAVGDLVLAYNEETGETGYYTVTAVIAHVDPSIVELTIDGDPSASSGTETLETTAEHPFYVVASAPPALSLVEGWLVTGETEGRWVNAGELEVGDAVRQADGTTGMVHAVVVVERRQPMYNLTVAVAHTFFVGQQQWLVHNCSVKVEVSRSKYPESAQHIEDAQAAGHPKDLTIDRSGKNANRQESLSGTDRVPGKDRDEYPPAMFQEGGSGASVRPIDPSDNRGAGACIGNQCRGLPDGTNVEIVVVP